MLFIIYYRLFLWLCFGDLSNFSFFERTMMKCQHVNPEEAVKIHEDLGARKSIGIHWRTFQLSTEVITQYASNVVTACVWKNQEVFLNF